MRPGCWANASVAKIRATATAATLSARRVIFELYIMNVLPMSSGVPPVFRRLTPGGSVYSFRNSLISLFLEQVGLDHRPQFRGHFGADAEPELEATDRLMQQHP